MKKKLYIVFSLLFSFCVVMALLIYVDKKHSNNVLNENYDSTKVDNDINNRDELEPENNVSQDSVIKENENNSSIKKDSNKTDTTVNQPKVEKPKEDNKIPTHPSTSKPEIPEIPSVPSQSTPTPIIPDNPIEEPTNHDKEEEPVTNNENEPDPTHPLYSRHLGHIDFKIEKYDNDQNKTFNACMDKGFEINFAHPVDIVSFSCVEVYSKTQKFLGYYLELTCIDKCSNDFKQP